ncbi:hypothetical protein OG747_22195 [Streptomyces sp. NBC_01384]|uniref:hypothetical protein n=1 Tax=Streptomyces sp. NBC_01384 TaxID=2903847 RepID=UPI003251D415
MGRRTVGWRAALWHGRTLAAVATLLCAAVVLPGLPVATAAAFTAPETSTAAKTSTGTTGTTGTGTSTPKPYAFAKDATTVEGTTDTTNAVRLAPGRTYRSSLGRDGKLYYRLELDATSNAYVSATAVPRPGTTVSYADGVKVSVQDGNSSRCSSTATAYFGASQSPHPIAAWASREIGPNKYACQAAGTYYVVVERSAASASSSSPSSSASPSSAASPDDWDLELSYVSEPRLKKAGSTSAPEIWNSASPDALQGDARPRTGGTGFTTAGTLGQGVWKDGISPGQTLFYKVPVGWGQQFYATAELGSSSGGDGFVGTALVMSLYNPVRGFVDDVNFGYDGSQRTAALNPLPPVAYDNRYAPSDRIGAMRFAGSYYLVVHLATQVADRFGDGPFGLTLRVRVAGAAQAGPAYAGRAEPRDVFDAAAADSEETSGATVGTGNTGDGGSGDGTTMKLVAVGGIGTGTVLVLALAVWTAVARRRARVGVEEAVTATTTVSSPPRGW